MKSRIQIVIIFIAAAILASCLRTELPPLSSPPALERLQKLNTKAVTVRYCPSSLPQTAGRQYLFIAIPFGRVVLSSAPADVIAERVRERLIIKGYRVREVNDDSAPTDLEICPRTLTVNAHDILLTRIITGSIELTIEAYSTAGKSLFKSEVEGSATLIRRFGFEQELGAAMREAVEDLAPKLDREIERWEQRRWME